MNDLFKELGFEIELNENVKNVLIKARELALAYNHDLCTTDHILINLLDEENIIKLLEKTGIASNELKNIRKEIDELIRKNIKPNPNQLTSLPRFSISFLPYSILERIKQRKYDDVFYMEGNRKFYKVNEYELLAILLNTKIIELSMTVKYFAKKVDLKKLIYELEAENANNILENTTNKYLKTILMFCDDINEKAKNLDETIIGRDKEINDILKILMRKKKSNVLILGEPGVGKTSLIYGLAQKINNKTCNQKLCDFRIFSLNVDSLISGAFLRGELESRIKSLFDSIVQYSKNENKQIILFIDEIHMLVGLGSSDQMKTNDASNILKRYLTESKIKFIGATTLKDYYNNIERDKALNRRFYTIIIDEPSRNETFEILKNIIPSYESFHKVKYSDDALYAAIDLTSKYIIDKKLPDKAIDILDITGAHVKLNEVKNTLITGDLVKKQFSEISKIPLDALSFDSEYDDNEKLNNLFLNLENKLKETIFGQDEAIREIVDQLIIARSGLHNQEKPLCSFLLNGPTGTGKTELCKKIAEIFGIKMLRLDMSEYMEEHSVSKLLGAPPGYIGFDSGAKLTDWVNSNPNSLILLDEIEKAHPKILNILLQILDYGKLTNSKNVTVDFKQTMIFMTSNIGASVKSIKLGFGNEHNINDEQNEEIFKLLPPELRNRFDGIILFKPLTEEVSLKIIDKFIGQLNNQLKSRNINLIPSENLKKYLLREGFDEKMGARPLERIINKKIKKVLAEKLLKGEIQKDQEIIMDYDGNNVTISISKLKYHNSVPKFTDVKANETILNKILKYF